MKLTLPAATALAVMLGHQHPDVRQGRPPSVKEKFDEVYMLSGFEPTRPDVVAWGRSLKGWLREAPDDARALTAYGGFLECLISRLSDSQGYHQLADEFPPIERGCVISSSMGGRREYCFKPIKAVYQRALRANPEVEEARLRLAGLQLAAGGDETKTGRRALEQLADSASSRVVRYTANLLLATHELRGAAPDLLAAESWFKAAAALYPEWVSARLGAAAVAARQGKIAVDLDTSGAIADPWYSYPCRVLDPQTAAALAARTQGK